MKFIERIKAKISAPTPIREPNRPAFAMTAILRHNAEGLEAHYGDRKFIHRIRAAADIIDELETALRAIAMSTTDKVSREIADDALNEFERLRK